MVVKSRVAVKCPKCNNNFIPKLSDVRSAAGRSSRSKGSRFELKVAKELKKWWNEDNKFNYDFKRTPMSGGSKLKDGFDMAGDICTNADNFIFHLELKNAPSSFTGLHNFMSHKSTVWKWLEQACNDCPENKAPILIINRYDQPTYCCTPFLKISNLLSAYDINYFTYSNNIICSDIIIWLYKDMLASDVNIWKELTL